VGLETAVGQVGPAFVWDLLEDEGFFGWCKEVWYVVEGWWEGGDVVGGEIGRYVWYYGFGICHCGGVEGLVRAGKRWDLVLGVF